MSWGVLTSSWASFCEGPGEAAAVEEGAEAAV